MLGREHPSFEVGEVTHPEISAQGLHSDAYFDRVFEMTKGQRLSQAELGVMIGKAFLAVHQEYVLDNPALILETHRHLERTVGDSEKAKQLMSGWLGEFAVAYALYNLGLDQEVYYPSSAEDLSNGVDWWVAIEDVYIPVQVKILPFTEYGAKTILNQMVYRLPQGDAELRSLVSMLTGYQMLGDKSSQMNEKGKTPFDSVYSSAKRCAQVASPVAGGRVMPALITLPSVFGEQSVINTDSGTFVEHQAAEHNAGELEAILEHQLRTSFVEAKA